MATKNDTEVIINGKVYRLCGYESTDYLQKIAMYMNEKIEELAGNESYARLSQEMKQLLLDINIADDYFKAKKQADFIENNSEQRDRQLYDVKQDLVSSQLKIEELEAELSSLKETYDAMEKEKIRLEAELKSTKKLINSSVSTQKPMSHREQGRSHGTKG